MVVMLTSPVLLKCTRLGNLLADLAVTLTSRHLCSSDPSTHCLAVSQSADSATHCNNAVGYRNKAQKKINTEQIVGAFLSQRNFVGAGGDEGDQ